MLNHILYNEVLPRIKCVLLLTLNISKAHRLVVQPYDGMPSGDIGRNTRNTDRLLVQSFFSH